MSSNSRKLTCQKSDGKLTVTKVYTIDHDHSMESLFGDEFVLWSLGKMLFSKHLWLHHFFFIFNFKKFTYLGILILNQSRSERGVVWCVYTLFLHFQSAFQNFYVHQSYFLHSGFGTFRWKYTLIFYWTWQDIFYNLR